MTSTRSLLVLALVALAAVPASATTSVSGDPHFVGFDGAKFDFDGMPGATFNLISTPTTSCNAMLGPDHAQGLTYVSAIGCQQVAGDRVKVSAVPDAKNPTIMVEVGEHITDISPGEVYTSQGVTIMRVDSANVEIKLAELKVAVHLHKGHFLDLQSVELLSPPAAIHGALGQTAVDRGYVGIEGIEEDYFVSGIWGTDHKFNVFGIKDIDGKAKLISAGRPSLDDELILSASMYNEDEE